VNNVYECRRYKKTSLRQIKSPLPNTLDLAAATISGLVSGITPFPIGVASTGMFRAIEIVEIIV
jgi:hypothetical protein